MRSGAAACEHEAGGFVFSKTGLGALDCMTEFFRGKVGSEANCLLVK